MTIDKKAIIQNLRDAGCSEQAIECFVKQKGDARGKTMYWECRGNICWIGFMNTKRNWTVSII
jgi:hypothetical protein